MSRPWRYSSPAAQESGPQRRIRKQEPECGAVRHLLNWRSGAYVEARAMKISFRKSQLAAATLADPRWTAVVARAAAAAGAFYYSVTTTGVNCRPSCAARRARTETVRIRA